VKPIIGCEVYVPPVHPTIKTKRSQPHHLVLLARNNVGYRNLSRLVSLGHLEGYYGKPRIDKEILRQYSEGLIGLSACMSGEVPRLILAGNLVGAWQAAQEYRSIFEPDCYYLEIQKNGLVEQDRINEAIPN